MSAPLVAVEGLTKHFTVAQGTVRAVDGVSFAILRGETFGLVGESGCGKSTVGRLLMRLVSPTAGRVFFDGEEITRLDGDPLRRRRAGFQMVFQDPFGSLNPRQRVLDAIREPLDIHGVGDAGARRARALDLMHRVGLGRHHADRYPHEFSGGQRQRIGIARALVLQPKFLVCDEAVSALDVSIQAQIVNLLKDLQRDLGLTLLFIAHDLAVVKHISDRIGVMYLGRLVEIADGESFFAAPLHPYSQALLSAIPTPRPGARTTRLILAGEVPSPMVPPPGCRFHTRCPVAVARCRREEPPLVAHSPGRAVACHLVGPGEPPPVLARNPSGGLAP